MIVIDKKINVVIHMSVSATSGRSIMCVEITDGSVVLRSRGIQTEVATNHPGRIANAVYALIPDLYKSEVDAVVSKIIDHL